MITIDSVSFNYPRKAPFFENLNLALSPGNIYGLLGLNGAGKTTLLKLMAGLLAPKKGVISVAGYHPFDRDPEFLENIYFLPEQFEALNVSVNRYAEMTGPFYSRFDKDIFKELLDLFEISVNDKLKGLSFGQAKKAMLAFMFGTKARFLFMDEPTYGLDIPGKDRLRTAVLKYLQDGGIIILATHQAREIDQLISRILVLNKGRILLNAEMWELANKVRIDRMPEEPAAGDTIYHEKAMGGFRAVSENLEHLKSDIDLELLFNAVLSRPEWFTKKLNTGARHV